MMIRKASQETIEREEKGNKRVSLSKGNGKGRGRVITEESKDRRLMEALEGLRKKLASSPLILRFHHYHTIEVSSKEIELVDGNMEKLGRYENTVKGIREARITAIEHYVRSGHNNEGYLFN